MPNQNPATSGEGINTGPSNGAPSGPGGGNPAPPTGNGKMDPDGQGKDPAPPKKDPPKKRECAPKPCSGSLGGGGRTPKQLYDVETRPDRNDFALSAETRDALQPVFGVWGLDLSTIRLSFRDGAGTGMSPESGRIVLGREYWGEPDPSRRDFVLIHEVVHAAQREQLGAGATARRYHAEGDGYDMSTYDITPELAGTPLDRLNITDSRAGYYLDNIANHVASCLTDWKP